jgi:putative transposase
MSHSFSKIWVHAIWSTKERDLLIKPKIEPLLHDYLGEQLRELGCFVKIINGMPDHIHCLFMLNREKSIADVIKQVKGASSHYINQNDLINEKFAWQTGYAAYSVSESILDKVLSTSKIKKFIIKRKPLITSITSS